MASASRVFSPPDSAPAGCSTSSPENRNAPSTRAIRRRSGRGAADCACSPAPTARCPASRAPARSSPSRRPWPGSTSPVSGWLDAGQQPQQRGLAGTVQPEHHHPAAPVDGQVDVGEHLERAVRLRQSARRSAGSGRTAPAPGTAAWPPCRDRGPRLEAGRSRVGPASASAARRVPWSPWPASCRPATRSASILRSALARSRLRRRSSVSRCCR